MLGQSQMDDIWNAAPDQDLIDALPELQRMPPLAPLGVASPLDGLMAHPGPLVQQRRPQLPQHWQTEVPTMHVARRVDKPDPWPMVCMGAIAVCGLFAPIMLTALNRDPSQVAMEQMGAMAREIGRPSYTCVSWSCPPMGEPAPQQPATAPVVPAVSRPQTVIFQSADGRQRHGVVEAIAGRDDAVMIRFVDYQDYQ